MSDTRSEPRVDRASRLIAADARTVYEAFLDPEAVAAWLPPEGMSARVDVLEPRPGGALRITLFYDDGGTEGKTAGNTDVTEGRFIELVPGKRIVQAYDFISEDPAFAGTMRQIWTFEPRDGGTQTSVACENVPEGIRPEDHQIGLNSTLANLAAYTESA